MGKQFLQKQSKTEIPKHHDLNLQEVSDIKSSNPNAPSEAMPRVQTLSTVRGAGGPRPFTRDSSRLCHDENIFVFM